MGKAQEERLTSKEAAVSMAPSDRIYHLHQSVKSIISAHKMILPGTTVVLGVSGGPDSVALMHVLHALKSDLRCSIHVAHLDHALRSDSRADAEFTFQAAERLDLPCSIRREDVRTLAANLSMSLEEAGRKARYDYFRELLRKFPGGRIATAHHLDDTIETFFLRILRGSSLQGIQGIRPVHGAIIRPFAHTTRSEVLEYLEDAGIQYRIDPTNLTISADRNFIRHDIIPAVQKRFPQYRKPLARTMELIGQEDRFISRQASELFNRAVRSTDSGLTLSIEPLWQADEVLVARVIILALYETAGPYARIGRVHVESMKQMIYSENPSGRISLPNRLEAVRNYAELRIARKESTFQDSRLETEIPGPGTYQFGAAGPKISFEIIPAELVDVNSADGAETAFFDAEQAAFPVVLRSVLPGDRCRPWPGKGSRKIKSILIDAKIPRHMRKLVPLLFKGDECLWIGGLRRGNAAPVTDTTQTVLKVMLTREGCFDTSGRSG
ncbi:tRNA lysidine(34) synthetase TilS [Desulfomonile tiedjei]|uniref:tRNA(Ile)-lysidine synthase n=1 Tax=Desulfomonile tiedjei (strain ATCC 49306 / DSM 6799 / DCB-1) TaxID=706587 RepID=I4CC32_DESTA|nr:tRNA lysidine(34) synthetase TilS [Desulfomonile tiedjei]AFM27123.1 tRNA(Ile)-lysidine synthetase [Desulfomonile tiedjei DSM 6799]